MADETKLMLSDGELHFVKDTQWFLTKQKITETVYQLMHAQVPVITNLFAKNISADFSELKTVVPKISRGEQYLSLPYIILDYPSVFEKDNIFALRTMFWWGNFISVTLHLSGKYKEALAKNILRKLKANPDGIFICINENQWQHHFGPDNYIEAAKITNYKYGKINVHARFLKLSVKLDLLQWNEMPALLIDAYQKMATLIKT